MLTFTLDQYNSFTTLGILATPDHAPASRAFHEHGAAAITNLNGFTILIGTLITGLKFFDHHCRDFACHKSESVGGFLAAQPKQSINTVRSAVNFFMLSPE